MDGEGSIMLYRRRDKAALRISFTNCDKAVLDWIADVTACGTYSVRPSSDKHKQSFILALNADAAASLLQQVRPYLRIKHKQADLALDFQERLKTPALNASRSWQFDYLNRIKAMNRRGPQN
jgi:hypothetical protein